MRLALAVCLRAMLQPRGHANVRQHANEKIALLPKCSQNTNEEKNDRREETFKYKLGKC